MNTELTDFLFRHRLALLVFTLLATVFLWDVLLLDYSLGAFDIILNQASWKGEFSSGGVHQPILIDSPTAHYPQRELDWGHARQFSNVEFNPYIFTGIPWSPQGVGAFVTSLPQLFLDIGDAIDWSTWFRLICAGFFMYLLMVDLGLDRVSGIFSGILWTYNLHQVVWLEFPQHLATQLWIPLLFLFNVRILREGPTVVSSVALLAVNILFFTGGYMQIVLYTYLAVGLFNTFYALAYSGEEGIGRTLRRWTAVHAVYVGAVLICSVGLFAEAQYISEGLRGAQEWRGRVSEPELSIASLTGLALDLVPRFTESTQLLTPDYYGGIWEGPYQFEQGNIVETGRYFGVLGLLFAITALFTVWGTRHTRMIVALVLTMALIFSMIYRNEFTISALRLVPLADKGSYSRFITLLTFIGCVLAGCGFQYALGNRYRWLFASLGLLCAYALAAWLQTGDFAFAKLWYPALIVAGLTAAIVIRSAFQLDWAVVGGFVVLATAVDLFAAGYAFNSRTENDRLFPTNNTIRYLLNDPEPYRVAVISDKPLYHPNILSYYHIPTVAGYLTVLPVEYTGYIKTLFSDAHVTSNGILFLFEPNVEALRLLNVKYVLSDKPLDKSHDGLERVLDSNNHAVYRIKNHLPRVFCASDLFYAGDNEKPVGLYEDRLGEYDEPVVVSGTAGDESFPGSCRIGNLNVYTHGLRADIETEKSRYLVVPYAFNEHWSARINGKPAELEEANGYHMAVRVPAGVSMVEILYRNPWNQLAAGIFILVSLGLLLFVWRTREGSGVLRLALGVTALLIIFKSSLSLPLLRNDAIPERAPVAEPLDVMRQGVVRAERELLSDRIFRGSPVELPLDVESEGLTSLSLLAGTFRQPRLAQTVTVQIKDRNGNVLVERRVEGKYIGNNSWFTVRFPPIGKDVDLRVRVSTEESAMDKSFVLWLEKDGRVCVQSFYALGSQSMR